MVTKRKKHNDFSQALLATTRTLNECRTTCARTVALPKPQHNQRVARVEAERKPSGCSSVRQSVFQFIAIESCQFPFQSGDEGPKNRFRRKADPQVPRIGKAFSNRAHCEDKGSRYVWSMVKVNRCSWVKWSGAICTSISTTPRDLDINVTAISGSMHSSFASPFRSALSFSTACRQS
jgi:hypothetical protein